MVYEEIKGDLFYNWKGPERNVYYAHCISADMAMGAGIAVDFNEKFNIRNYLLEKGYSSLPCPSCVLVGQSLNLVTKMNYWDKPSNGSMLLALRQMRKLCEVRKIRTIKMPRIGSGLDRLHWSKVREMIQNTFKDDDISITVYHL